jgi:membrane protein YdbS with pleckstrin-like domain
VRPPRSREWVLRRVVAAVVGLLVAAAVAGLCWLVAVEPLLVSVLPAALVLTSLVYRHLAERRAWEADVWRQLADVQRQLDRIDRAVRP